MPTAREPDKDLFLLAISLAMAEAPALPDDVGDESMMCLGLDGLDECDRCDFVSLQAQLLAAAA
jgi:hypothetical protein